MIKILQSAITNICFVKVQVKLFQQKFNQSYQSIQVKREARWICSDWSFWIQLEKEFVGPRVYDFFRYVEVWKGVNLNQE